MRKGIAISAAAAALAMTAASVAPAAAASEQLLSRGPIGVTIEIATVNGSGCPPKSAAVALSKDNEAFTVTYSKYTAQTGGASSPPDARKNCQINMTVHVPQGYTYAIASTDYRGYASLQAGANATQLASYYFQGDPSTRQYSHSLNGPYGKSWQSTDKVNVSQLVWKPCGEERNFNINTELRVDQGTSIPSKVSLITMDSTDNTIKTTYHYAWKPCPPQK
ncbi:DUF4360 domain-containing protein [Actinomadura rubrisoli]|uniref:DUF4360 domain-containing protein n=1 Tax=Actinomadura rubrisoli TaxID=2530368 RepID=A0A4R5CDW7_9ACTN|nr:DUF4360 domain-containing protein [Actinomadura rubrisoli]TDD96433.1 DUF4360 domain-containing protein [Actinomadura rubrisoli]